MQASLALSSACSCCTCAFCYFSCAFSFRNIFFLFLPFFSRCYFCYCSLHALLLAFFNFDYHACPPTLLSALPLSPLPQRYCALQQASRKASKNVSLIREVSCFECPQLVGSTRLPSLLSLYLFLPLSLSYSLSLSLPLCFAAAVPVCVGDVVKSFICR